MNLLAFLKDKLLLLTLQAACMLALAAFLYVTGYPAVCGGIVLLGWVLILTVWLLGEYVRRNRYFRQIEQILENADQKYLLGELMPESFRLEDRLYRDMIRRSNKSVIEKIHELEDARKDYREYIESWIHEVKAPIASICLLCEKQKGETGRRILMENGRTENYVDMALFYARSDEVYKDYLIKETTLQGTAEEVLRKNKYYLIQNRIQAEVRCPDIVYTDAKWIAFILNQVVLNAVKYQRDSEPRIVISTERKSHSVLLAVEDNGIGICPEDLPRIFDKGFTGTNGRAGLKSTGMGLYLCRKLCGKLGIRIGAQSEEGRGTRITLEFPVSNYLARR